MFCGNIVASRCNEVNKKVPGYVKCYILHKLCLF